MLSSLTTLEGKMVPNKQPLTRGFTLVALAALAALSGCTADADAGSAIGDLIRDDGGLPLLEETASTDAWWLAPPGCEGLIDGDGVAIAIASLEHGLVAAVDSRGDIVCVDTVEAVGEELDQLGRHADAQALSTRFSTSAEMSSAPRDMEAPVEIGGRYAGDPHPEPNDGCPSCGDPHPEPN